MFKKNGGGGGACTERFYHMKFVFYAKLLREQPERGGGMTRWKILYFSA